MQPTRKIELTEDELERLDLIMSIHETEMERHYLRAYGSNDNETLERLKPLVELDRRIRDKLYK